ncbi:MAG: hypothetical protein KGS09_14430 [Nitrospirae bacterium]|nr:hypothetical protein [Nitrospirota bacterium]
MAIFAVLQMTSPCWAKLAPYDGIGGPGGAPFRLDCGESGLLVGVTGRSGIVIDQIGGLCVKVDPISGVWVGGAYETAHYGGTGGQPFNRRCPVGQALWGLEGSVNYFDGTPVVGSINIKCVEIGIHPERVGATIEGTRLIDYYGDPDPVKVQAEQDYCDTPRVGTDVHRESRVWSRIGVALEGRSGLFVDRVHIVCGSIPTNQTAYHIDFKPSSYTIVPEGTPLQINWRASGVKPELTPNLRYEWVLKDWTHTGTVFGIAQPTTVQNACAYAVQPCTSSWFGSSSFSSVTLTSLPVAAYELELSVSPTSAFVPSKGSVRFEVRPNLLVSLAFSVQNVRAGAPTTGTVIMEGPAPPKGRILYLYTSNPNLVQVPPSITVPGGSATGTFTLRPNSAPGSAGEVTISVSIAPPISAKLSTGVQSSILSRGLEEASQPAQSSQETDGQQESDPTPAAATQQSSSEAETVSQGEVTERGVSPFKMAKPSTGIQSAIVTPPTAASPIVTLPSSQVAAAATQLKPGSQLGPVAAGRLSLPGNTKSAVLTVQLPFGAQLPSK